MNQTSLVALQRCQSYDAQQVYNAVCRQFELLGGVDAFFGRNQRVLIKPNLIVPYSPEIPAQTHPEVIYAAARCVKDAGGKPLVGDSPAWGNVWACLKALGVDKRLKHLGVEIVQLNNPVPIQIEDSVVRISRTALEADAIINLPKLKTHQQLTATFAFKNMFGCVAGLGGKEKAWWHFARGDRVESFCRLIIGIFQRLNPVLNLIDGIVGMEGQGPINGSPRQIGYLIASRNPAACERICCQLVGFNPKDLPLLQTAEQMGYTLDSTLEITGDTFDGPICPDFVPAVQTPLRFSLPRICKSITLQGWMLLKNKWPRHSDKR
ncbi:MAG TPA: DUF362 domain-containing protein [Anaerohalosphaeraceae bacterium]|nr:DUF362 domain-containing protein [Anaerohalosphaeraceae bacterium]HOM74913.1 DUF362 domain-containing protein [Anaerohalosphaeraceae bacterium]HPC63876.1 DUF362 domain-containing protein [Anaerohalosphaeraceae bacterium]HPO68717.1 DUF362 domain-containing protein [Anaerohalosphaeraceae bacterium]HRS70539.1 DUF362 domain-containing protein [Anaerohalosphaeraceae bacterium]